jgi:hypothetical protein
VKGGAAINGGVVPSGAAAAESGVLPAFSAPLGASALGAALLGGSAPRTAALGAPGSTADGASVRRGSDDSPAEEAVGSTCSIFAMALGIVSDEFPRTPPSPSSWSDDGKSLPRNKKKYAAAPRAVNVTSHPSRERRRGRRVPNTAESFAAVSDVGTLLAAATVSA